MAGESKAEISPRNRMTEIAESASKNADMLYMLAILAAVAFVAYWSEM